MSNKLNVLNIPEPGKNLQLLKSGSTGDVVAIMQELIKQASKDPQIQQLAAILKAAQLDHLEVCNSLLNFATRSIYYATDPAHTQQIRTPTRSLADGKGNCVDYAVLIGSILKALNISAALRIVRFAPSTNFGHVYIVSNGVVIDPVILQDESGSEQLTRPPGKHYTTGRECEYQTKIDFLI